jgi:integrase
VPRKATGSADERNGKLYAIVTDPKTKERVWLECPDSITNLPKARRYAAYISEQVREGKYDLRNPATAPVAARGEHFKDWSERWLDARKLRGLASIDDQRSCLKTHVWPLLDKPIKSVTADDLENVRDALDQKVRDKKIAWKTAVNVWGVVTVAFGEATRGKNRSLRVLAANPALGLEGPDRGAGTTCQYLYPDEALRVISADSTPWRWALLFTLAIYTGLRAGELEALTWADVDLVHQTLSVAKAVSRKTGQVGPTKTKETRRLPIEPELLPLLRKLRPAEQARQGERVCWLPPDEDRAEGLRRYLTRAGIKRKELLENTDTTRWITFHDLRGTYITWLAVRGEAPLVIQQRAGHSQFTTTAGYIRSAEHLGSGFGQVFPVLPARLLEPG